MGYRCNVVGIQCKFHHAMYKIYQNIMSSASAGERCEVCQRTKRKFDKPTPSLHPISVSDTWNKVGIDLIKLPVSKNGDRYCITLTDYFSKWAEACPIPTKEARHVADFLRRYSQIREGSSATELLMPEKSLQASSTG